MNTLNFVKRACGVLALCVMTAAGLPAQTLTVLHVFTGPDGGGPNAALVQATDGNLYGTTEAGGAFGGGTVFRITPDGTLTTLYSFCSQSNCADGNYPYAGLIQAIDGNFYGTTYVGGAYGYGTVFKITAGGTLTTLYSFCAQSGCPDGWEPAGTLIQANDGNFYGTTVAGGATVDASGTVFRITPGGTLTTLYSFCSQGNCADGAFPYAGLIQATDGNFYGTTQFGGLLNDYLCSMTGCGTVFKITSSGTLTTLYSFCSRHGCRDGSNPRAGLIQSTDGNLYGTTYVGGTGGAYGGTVFRMTLAGVLTTIANFSGQNGELPGAGLDQATDGNFYGTTVSGGTEGNKGGTIFEITATGNLSTLYSFCFADCYPFTGDNPEAGLVQDTNGEFYGTTYYDGGYGDGTVFALSTGLAPFVETQPNHSKPGRVIQILGTNLTGATSVTFNGTPAVFKVATTSLIGAIVPEGATSGTVQVTTPSGVLSSNVPFRVVQ